MNVNEVYQLILYIVNKNQNGYLSPDEFNLTINQAQVSYMDYLVGQFQQYQAGRPIPTVQFGNNETTRQRVTPFIYNQLLAVDANGFSSYPSDYLLTDTMFTGLYGKIKFVQQDYLANYLNSRIAPVATNPIYLIEREGFRFYPNDIAQARVSYIKSPRTIVYGYTLNGDGLPVYNPSTSVDPEWQELDLLEIISRALRMISENLKDVSVANYANQITKTGQ
ncbi:MAG: hypothetical protein B7Y37_13845 [Sphingobacteriia bacterium 28-36-52]|nr:MAG: hypothetical protein B7Y37_13845 [Sphingobacteriia bacterium 28-36-52]